jgi:polar amino acid transport system substrate-binding protein
MQIIRIVLFFSVILACHNVNSQTIAPITDELSINIVAPELKPFIYNNVNKKAEGLLVETLTNVSKNSSLNINVTVLPWGRAMLEVMSGNADAIMPALYTEERAKSLVFPESQLINFYGSVLIKNIDDDFEFEDFEAIKQKKSVAKVRAVLLGEHFDKAKDNGALNIVEVTKLEDALNMLLVKRVDLVVADGFAAYTSIKGMGIEGKISVMSISSIAEPSFLAFSSQFSRKHDVNKVMSIINKFNNPEQYKQILPTD